MTLRSQLAYLAAGLVLVLGLLGLLNPHLLLGLAGLQVREPRGLGEARAVFGAFFLVMGGFMLWALSVRPRARGILRFVGFLWLGSALGRLLSLFLDGSGGQLALGAVLLLAFDLAVGAGSLLGSTEPGSKPTAKEGNGPGEADSALKAYRS